MLLKNLIMSSGNILMKKRPLVRSFSGGVPGNNLPWRKGMNNPTRFAAFYLVIGIVGFGAPWLVIMHQMLRPYDYVVD